MYWVMTTRMVNSFLGSAYAVEDIRRMPADQLDVILLCAREANPK
ncbi:MAG: hypothetical protein WCF84_02340 [Anaerolineae bacterium]